MWCRVSSGTGLGSSALAASWANWSSPMPISTSGSSAGEPVLQADRPRVPLGLPRQPGLEHRGDLLEGAVLEQPGEQQVARLEQREVLLVLDVALRQQPGGLEVEQGGGDQEERRGLVEVPLRRPAARAGLDVRDELVGDLRQRDLGDVELVLRDQAEQQVEGTLEVVQAELEGAGLGARRCRGSRSRTVIPRQPADQGAVLAVLLEVGEDQEIASRSSRPRSTARPCSAAQRQPGVLDARAAPGR